MTELIRDNLEPQFLSTEAVYLLRRQVEAFDNNETLESQIGGTAVANVLDPQQLDAVGIGPFDEPEFVGKLYDGVLVCLDRVNPVVLGKRHHSSNEKRILNDSTVYAEMLSAGMLAEYDMPHLPPKQQTYARYCQLLAEKTTLQLDQLGFGTIDQLIQYLRHEGDFAIRS